MTSSSHYDRSVTDMLADLIRQVAALFRSEAALARAEASEKLSHLSVGLGLAFAGAILLIPALVLLLEAAATAMIDAGMDAHWATLLTGGCAALVGFVLIMVGMSRLRVKALVPERTIHQFQEDVSVARRQVRQNDDTQRAA